MQTARFRLILSVSALTYLFVFTCAALGQGSERTSRVNPAALRPADDIGPDAFGIEPIKGNCDIGCRQQLAAARTGTAAYHDIGVALADGFVAATPCVRLEGVGTMGFHYRKISRIDQLIDASEPEVLIYLPNDDGVMELVAVEYIVPNIGQPGPELFGQTYEYNLARNRYELHAWIWKHNPAGMFEDYNPRLKCPGF